MSDFELRDLSKHIGGRAILDGVVARMEVGRICVIIGPNGAGKSTLLSLMAGLTKPIRGAALWAGKDVAAMTARQRAARIGFLPQSAELHWDLRVEDLVALGRMSRRGQFARLSDDDRKAIDDALDETDTRRFLGRATRSLSGGERARVLLARLLAGEPEWILADEPLASLDPAHQIEVLATLKCAAAGKRGVVLVLHDLTLAHWIADDVLVLKDGQVMAHGARSVLERPGLLEQVYGVAIDRIVRPGRGPLIVPVPMLRSRDG